MDQTDQQNETDDSPRTVEERLASAEAALTEMWQIIRAASGAINRLERVAFSAVRLNIVHGGFTVDELVEVGAELDKAKDLRAFWAGEPPAAEDETAH